MRALSSGVVLTSIRALRRRCGSLVMVRSIAVRPLYVRCEVFVNYALHLQGWRVLPTVRDATDTNSGTHSPRPTQSDPASPGADSDTDLVIDVESPGGEDLRLVVEVNRMLDPREVPEAVSQARSVATALDAVPVIGASYLSPRSRELLIDEQVGYVDSTGNIRIASDSPGMFVLMTGAQRDPWPRESDIQSLRGRASARALRAIVDFTRPFGIREVAERSGTSPASLSRVAGLLDREALIVRDGRGAITDVDWRGAIERWTRDYDQIQSNTAHRFLAPRGLEALRRRQTGLVFGGRVNQGIPQRWNHCLQRQVES